MALLRRYLWMFLSVAGFAAVANAGSEAILVDESAIVIEDEQVEIIRDLHTPKKFKVNASFVYLKKECREMALREVYGQSVSCGTENGVVRSCYHSEDVCSISQNRTIRVQRSVIIKFSGISLLPGQRERYRLNFNSNLPSLKPVETVGDYQIESGRFFGRDRINVARQ